MDAGGLPVYSTNANQSAHQLSNQLHLQQQQHIQANQLVVNQFQAQQQQSVGVGVPSGPQQQQNLVQGLSSLCQQQQQQQQQQQSENLPPKRHQAVVDRLRRRIENYRRRQTDCVPRYNQAFSSGCEQQNIETHALQKRYLEPKAKKSQKKTEKKQQETTLAGNLQSSVHVQKTFLKRPSDDIDNGLDSYEPPVKLQHNQSENLTKFSVEIVQQLEFTTSAANSQPQQISTNVTVKALTNTSVKSDNSNSNGNVGGGSGGGGNVGIAVGMQQTTTTNNGGGNCNGNNQNKSKSPQPNDNELGHLIECKQEPDNDFPDLAQCAVALEKDEANGHYIGFSDLLGDELISELSGFNYLEFDKPTIEIKTENDSKQDLLDNIVLKSGSPMTQYNQASSFNEDAMKSQAAQMQQHQQQQQHQRVGMPPNYNQTNNNNVPNTGLPELIPAAQKLKHMAEQHQHKNAMGMNFVRPPQPQVNNARSPYREFNQFGNPDFMNNPQTQMGGFNKNSVPTGPGNFPSPDMIKQEILYSPQNDFESMKQRMGQMGQPTKIPPSYKQQYSPYGSPMSNHGSPGQSYMPQRSGGPQQSTNGPPPRPSSGPGVSAQGPTTLQMKQTQQLHITNHSGSGHGIQVSAGQHMHLSGEFKNGVSVAAQQQNVFFSHQHAQQQQQTSNINQQNSANPNSRNQQNPNNPNVNSNQGSNNSGNNGNSNSNPMNSQTGGGNGGGLSDDTYSVTQTQSINFTQPTLRQRGAANQPQSHMNPGGSSNLPGQSGPTPQQQQQQQNNPANVNLNQININQQQNQMGGGGNTSGVGVGVGGNNPNGNLQNNVGTNQISQNNAMTANITQNNDPMATLSQTQHMSINTLTGGASGLNGNLSMNPNQSMNFSGGNANNGSSVNSSGNNPVNPNLMNAGGGGVSGMGPQNFNPNINQNLSQQNVMGMNQGMISNEMGMNMGSMSNVPMQHIRQDQAKFVQQQQMLRAQALAQQHIGNSRPPPPEYKASQSQMIQAQMMLSGRFPNTNSLRRMGTQQPIPPSGPHLRPQHTMYMHHSSMTSGRGAMNGQYSCAMGGNQRPPNVQVGPEGLPISSQQEWRHLMMSQQQNLHFNGSVGQGSMRPGFNNNQGFIGGPQGGSNMSGMQSNQMQPQQQPQHQLMRQQSQPNPLLVNGINQNVPMTQLSQQTMISQMQMNTVHMSQTQTMSIQQQQQQSVMNSFNQQQQQQQQTNQSNPPTNNANNNSNNQQSSNNSNNNNNNSNNNNQNSNNSSNNNNQTSSTLNVNSNDFNLEFLENLPVGDAGNFSIDLLNSLENENFNFDILQ